MGLSRLDRADDFKKFCRSGLDRIQLLRIRIGLGLKNFTVRSSLLYTTVAQINEGLYFRSPRLSTRFVSNAANMAKVLVKAMSN